jgi:hypothetical protein
LISAASQGQAGQAADLFLKRGVELLQPPEGLGGEGQPAELRQQDGGPIGPRAGQPREAAHASGESRCLSIHQPRRLRLPECRALGLQTREAVAHQILHPALEPLDPLRHPLQPLRRPVLTGLGIGLGRGAFLPGLFLRGGSGPPAEPLLNPFGLGGFGERLRLAGSHEHQAEGVLAGKLAARATALRAQVGEVHPHLIEGAPLAFSPQGPPASSQTTPRLRHAELLAGGGGAGIGSQSEDLLGGEMHR